QVGLRAQVDRDFGRLHQMGVHDVARLCAPSAPHEGAEVMTTETAIRPIEVPEFTARVDQANGGLKMEMVGNADLNVTAMLDRLIEEIHREACRLGGAE